MVWGIGICLFGVAFAVPLRKEVIIREKLKFPTGTATALMIGVLHGEKQEADIVVQQNGDERRTTDDEEDQQLLEDDSDEEHDTQPQESGSNPITNQDKSRSSKEDLGRLEGEHQVDVHRIRRLCILYALVSLGWLLLRPTIYYSRVYGPDVWHGIRNRDFSSLTSKAHHSSSNEAYTPVLDNEDAVVKTPSTTPEVDAPPLAAHLAPRPGDLAHARHSTLLHLDTRHLNPVSGISKLTQLVFALVVPASNPNAITINLLAGAVSEAGALQAGDLMQDLKTGHLLGASPKAQFHGQMIGSVVGAVVSSLIYRLYTRVYEVPGPMFQVPTAYVWVFTARLVTGSGLPPRAAPFALAFGAIWAVLTALRTAGREKGWQAYIPGGIAIAVGMYNVPSFTLARAVGGAMAWYWTRWRKRGETTVIVLASGLILGEGLFSIFNLILASLNVPHLRGGW
ncbi:hypothetical protein MRB53_039637 [Persea americana]|nr:hypothetical protein MRB53_039637 [Persea americana]